MIGIGSDGMFHVYAITCGNTGKVYFGQSGNHHVRIHDHRTNLKKGCHAIAELQSDYNSHGEGDFVVEVKAIFATRQEAVSLEQQLIAEAKRRGLSYNRRCAGISEVPKDSDNRATIHLRPELMAYAKEQAANEFTSLSAYFAKLLKEDMRRSRRGATIRTSP